MADEQSMTARVCAFVRAYHAQQGGEALWDPWAGLLLTREEYEGVAQSMFQGIQWFCPGFSGGVEQALEWVVTHQLAPRRCPGPRLRRRSWRTWGTRSV